MDQTNPARSSYYADAATWSADVNGSLRTSRRLAWIVAAVSVFISVLLALALVLLTPLKTVVPYTITVDRQTGNAQLARGIVLGPLGQNDALIQSALAQYVIARETLDATDLAANYNKAGLWSAGTARADYLRSMDRRLPDSPLNGATAATQITTTIKQVTVMSPTTALVRFSTDRRDGDGPATRMDWAAVMQFGFTGGPLNMTDRLINPLGFQVTHYRRDAEALAPRVILPTAIPAVSSTTTTTTITNAPAAIVFPSTLPRLVTSEPAR